MNVFEKFFSYRKTRVKLVPRVKGPPIPVKQVLWLGLIWVNVEQLDRDLNKTRLEALEANQKLHDAVAKEKVLSEKVKRQLDKVQTYGDQLHGVGPVEEEKGSPLWFVTQSFIADPGKAFSELAKRLKANLPSMPHELGEWPPKDHDVGAGGKRTLYVPEEVYDAALHHRIVVKGRDAEEVIPLRKPQQQQNNNQRKKGGGNQQQQQQNQGGNQGGGN